LAQFVCALNVFDVLIERQVQTATIHGGGMASPGAIDFFSA
jgi:hypothetical protein